MDDMVKVAGYVSRFDVADRGGDVVRRRAFVGAPAGVPLLWQHDPSRPIGRVLSLTEDGVGLKMVADRAVAWPVWNRVPCAAAGGWRSGALRCPNDAA